jgi:urease accessory protein
MPRAVSLLKSSEARPRVIDTLILTSDQRRTQRATVTGEQGTSVEFDFAAPVSLRTDDTVLLDNGDAVEIVAAPEALMEVRGDITTLSKVAHALGDRHVAVQILTNRIRLQRAADLAALIALLGAKVTEIEAPFEPEGGAYAVDAHEHPRGHDHGDVHHHHGHHHHDHARCDHDHHDHGAHDRGHLHDHHGRKA